MAESKMEKEVQKVYSPWDPRQTPVWMQLESQCEKLMQRICRLDGAVATHLAQKQSKCPVYEKELEIYLRGDPFKGIIAHLTEECKGNVHEKSVVNVLIDKIHPWYWRTPVSSVVDLTKSSAIVFCDDVNMSICYDFKDRRIDGLVGYSIRSKLLKSWAIEVSEDGGLWHQADRVIDYSVIDSVSSEKRCFTIGGTPGYGIPYCGPCRYVRLRQTDKNHRGDYMTDIAAFEIFGCLKSSA